ncbi:MAG: polymerase subunit delta, polymerase subunit delta protein [Parcubacteria group bacterium]|nr:polymerase subunit delta, polymerase subunit delta protein [Parcubacteria group bacterium]
MEIDPLNLHHAYLIESAPEHGERFLVSLFEQIGFSTTQNPDYHLFNGETFLVEDARLLNARAQGKSFSDKKIFVITSSKINFQAQNALLKTFEEPHEGIHFFIILPERDLLLPTLLSRLQVVRIRHEESANTEAEKFLGSSAPERIKFSKKFIDKEKPLAPFLDSLLQMLKGNMEESKKVFALRAYASDPAVSPRLILEHLSLVLK